MKNYLKNQTVNEVQNGRLSRETMKQIKGGGSDLTLKQLCEADHAGRCGSCDNGGHFTPCG
ncbi:hypothetical protein NAF17_16285 [Mucilaginibacter sp. RB4R14]|uniref:hypothetical protein n=1 Tax=Mucilaginibacter aurantiaciroseus TaxID=2949308 RepID=UPI002090D155|nr:hypothetical protein [Mucilaginibacter aurantiaciroseus]MCO5937105.1 hypothetical protein [Mucilaginibacter aurantiaciroseus]